MAGAAATTGHRAIRHRLKSLLSLLLAVAIFAFLLRRVDLPSVLAGIREMTWLELVTIAAVAAWNLVTYWALWVAVTPGLTYGQAMTISQSGTAVTNTIPGGSGIGVGMAYAMLDSWGFSRARSTMAVLITGVWNNFIKFALPVLALAVLALQGDASSSRVTVGIVAIALLLAAVALFTLVLRSDRVAESAGAIAERAVSWARRLIRRPQVEGYARATVRFRARANELLQDRWLAITAAALASHLSLFLVLLVTLRHVGISNDEVSWAEALFVFAFARLATVIRFTPGGVGMVEALLIAGLLTAGGEQGRVTAAVLVFRGLTWLLPVPFGAVTYLVWRRRQARRGPVPVPAPVAVAEPPPPAR